LQVFFGTVEKKELVLESNHLKITIDGRLMKGNMDISTLLAMDEEAQKYLDQIELETISFEIQLPDGTFRFGNSLNKEITQEGEIISGDHRSKILMTFIVSNKKTTSSNTFLIIGNGDLKIYENLGVEVPEGLNNSFRFQFSLNMTEIKI
jgi:hypothetical protein